MSPPGANHKKTQLQIAKIYSEGKFSMVKIRKFKIIASYTPLISLEFQTACFL